MTEGENTAYYPLVKMDFASVAITLYYLNPTKGIMAHSHNFFNDTTEGYAVWSICRSTRSR